MSINDWVNRVFTAISPTQAVIPEAPAAAAVNDPVLTAYEALLTLREGRQTRVYRDSRGLPTVGIGHLVVPGDGLSVGDLISDERVDAFFAKDSQSSMMAAHDQSAQAGITDTAFLPYLASVCFQLGNAWIKKFPNTWAMICRGQYERAALAFNGTLWQEQTPVRASDFQAALRRLPPKA